MKRLTHDQLQSRKDKAVRFVHDVLADPDRAEEIAEESLEDYAARRKFQIVNPRRYGSMAKRRKTVAELEAEIEDLQEQVEDLEGENESLQDQLDQIGDIVAGEEEAEDEEDDGLGE